MIDRVTVDASVFVSRLRADDMAHAESRTLLEALAERPVLTVLPTLVRPEIAGAIRRFSGDPQIARRALEVLELLPNLNYAPLDGRLANDATELAAGSGMKGADAVYVATARLFDTVLVTLDAHQRERSPRTIKVMSPAEALAEMGVSG